MPFEDPFPPDRPTLILGLIGFTRDHEAALGKLLARQSARGAAWRLGPLSEADAWWANGARAQLLADGSLRIGSGEPGGRSVRLSLAELQRPIAFSEPLANRDFEPAYSFAIDDPQSIAAMLSQMERQWLGPTAARLWLAGRLIDDDARLVHRIYHLVGEGRLLAVVDRTGEVGLAPGATVQELEGATWLGRPSSARFIPARFQATTISELVWAYALRSEADLLPYRYRTGPIFFRRPPKVPQRVIGDDHLALMRELVVGPATFAELQQATGMGLLQLTRALGALYLAGSITSNPRRALRGGMAHSAERRAESLWSPTGEPSGFPGRPASRQPADFTVPANLSFAAAVLGEPVRPDPARIESS